MYKHKRYSPGFTIVELLTVIVVIGVLAAIAVVTYNGIQLRAHESAVAADLNTLDKKFKLFQITNGFYPSRTVNSGNDILDVLRDSQLYESTRQQADGSIKKRFAFCTPDANTERFVAVVVEPILKGNSSDYGKYTYAITEAGSVKKVQFTEVVAGGYGSNLCIAGTGDGRTTWTTEWGIQSHQLPLP